MQQQQQGRRDAGHDTKTLWIVLAACFRHNNFNQVAEVSSFVTTTASIKLAHCAATNGTDPTHCSQRQVDSESSRSLTNEACKTSKSPDATSLHLKRNMVVSNDRSAEEVQRVNQQLEQRHYEFRSNCNDGDGAVQMNDRD